MHDITHFISLDARRATTYLEEAMLYMFLRGFWQIKRDISYERSKRARVEGYASFAEHAKAELFYNEHGTLFLSGAEYTCSRTYLYRFGEQISIFFPENPPRLFMMLREQGKHFCGEHDCCQDRYMATYTLYHDHCFCIEYRVQGPKKAYEMKTLYWRA